jgi:hypothetical protein
VHLFLVSGKIVRVGPAVAMIPNLISAANKDMVACRFGVANLQRRYVLDEPTPEQRGSVEEGLSWLHMLASEKDLPFRGELVGVT